MLEIIVMIAVVKAFSKLAGEKKLNKTLWGFIGATSYYIPVLLVSLIILPALIMDGALNFGSEIMGMLLSILINITVGSLCCFVMYQVLKGKNSKKYESDILDEDLV